MLNILLKILSARENSFVGRKLINISGLVLNTWPILGMLQANAR
jgi:hypothetical protein